MDRPPTAANNLNSSRQPSVESQNPSIVYDTTDTINYMREVRDTFINQKEKYDAFIALMREYKDKRVDNPGVIAGLKKLFVGHPNLLLGFNKFLPQGFEITLDNEEEITLDELTRKFEEVLSFVKKERFESNHRVYTSSSDHVDAYKDRKKSIDEIYHEINTDHPLNAADNLNSSKQHSAESTRQNPPVVYDTTDAINYIREVRDTYLDQEEKYDAFIDLMREYKDKRVDSPGVIAGLKKLFVGHPNLLLGFNKFLPRGFEITLDNEEEVTPEELAREFEEAFSLVEKIKERFESNDHVYTSLLDHLNAYIDGNKSIDEVYREVALLFKDHPDLLVEFTKYIQEE